MKTRCPDCQTTFRVTPEQLKARAGKVRCGQCQTVFNALDSLLDEAKTSAPSAPQPTLPLEPAAQVTGDRAAGFVSETPAPEVDSSTVVDQALAELPGPDLLPLSEAAVQELGKASGLIMPRETTGIPGYSKWTEGVMAEPMPLSLSVDKPARWPFVFAALLLLLALAGQLAFRFRSEIAITLPSLRPALGLLCQALDADIPLPRHVELVNIEMSDLQTDPARGNLLVLNASLRNRANYGQAYPSLELSLTDTQDAAIARRVFLPGEYLSAKTPADQPFAANSDITVRLWIEAKGINAAGYRLYVFYP